MNPLRLKLLEDKKTCSYKLLLYALSFIYDLVTALLKYLCFIGGNAHSRRAQSLQDMEFWA